MVLSIDLETAKTHNLSLRDALVYTYLDGFLECSRSEYYSISLESLQNDLFILPFKYDTFYRTCKKLEKKKLVYVRYSRGRYEIQSVPFSDNKSFVYLMIDEHTSLYKIGKSINVTKREKTLCSQTPRIKLVHSFSREDVQERDLHKMFASKRVRGEWFELNDTDVQYIKSL